MNDEVCSICGGVTYGGHPSSCNGPTQEFISRAEFMRRRLAYRPIAYESIESWRARNADRLEAQKARDKEELFGWLAK